MFSTRSAVRRALLPAGAVTLLLGSAATGASTAAADALPPATAAAASLRLGLPTPAPYASRPTPGLAQRRHGPDRDRRRWRGEPDAHVAFDPYLLFKGGGLHVSEGDGTDGLYLGLEVGGTAAGVVDLGFGLDWFHRRTRDLSLLFETEDRYLLPVRGEITEFESSADLVPIGVTLRLRLPVGDGTVAPFVSGTLAWEVLRLAVYDPWSDPRPYDDVLGAEELFAGPGWQAAAGVQVAVAPRVGLFGELGVHRSEPLQEAEIDGLPVDLRVRLHGGFARAGLRVGL